jgi:hypothetical protein
MEYGVTRNRGQFIWRNMTLLKTVTSSMEKWQYNVQQQSFRHTLHCLRNTVLHNSMHSYINLWYLYNGFSSLTGYITVWVTDWLTAGLTLWRRVLLGRLVLPQPVQKFPVFYGNRKFIISCTKARQLSLYRARSIQSKLFQPIYLRSILMLSSHVRLGLPSDLFPSGSSYKH